MNLTFTPISTASYVTRPNHRHQKLTSELTYRDVPLIPTHAPYVVEYLDRLIATVDRSIADCKKVFAVRVDLRLPVLMIGQSAYDNRVIEAFFKSLKAKLKAEHKRRSQTAQYVSRCPVRYVWAREQVNAEQPHYHVLLLLNGNFFQSLGDMDYQSNYLSGFVAKAWQSALGIPAEMTFPLVHFPKNCIYKVSGIADVERESLLQRSSYFCKHQSKDINDGQHNFGVSRL